MSSRRLVFVAALGLAAPLGAQVVVPNELAAVEGPANNRVPFDPAGCGNGIRYQQIYDGGQVGAGTIHAIRFRPDVAATVGPPVTFHDVTVRLSSTPVAPDFLGNDLESNLGPVVTTVFHGDLTLGANASAAVPRPFELTIPLTTPFAFDPAGGVSLLLEIRIPVCGTLGFAMDYATENLAVSRAFVPDAQGTIATSRTSSVGLVTQFVTAQATGACVADAATLCIDDQPGDARFQVRVAYQTTQGGGYAGAGHSLPLATLGVARGGLFWFFSADNPEMVIKVLHGCSSTGHYWIYYSAATNVGLTTTVTDTVSGQVWTRVNPDRHPAPPEQDTSALPCDG
jgi:hypothetical protein